MVVFRTKQSDEGYGSHWQIGNFASILFHFRNHLIHEIDRKKRETIVDVSIAIVVFIFGDFHDNIEDKFN